MKYTNKQGQMLVPKHSNNRPIKDSLTDKLLSIRIRDTQLDTICPLS